MTTIQEYLAKWCLKLFHQRNCLLSFPHQKTLCMVSTQSRILSWKASTIPEWSDILGCHSWQKSQGCSFNVLKNLDNCLVYAPAEYCSQAWCQSAHAHKVDSQLYEAMHTISGCIRSTPTDFLSRILSPTTWRDIACLQLYLTAQSLTTCYMKPCMYGTPNRLCLRQPLRSFMENLKNHDFSPLQFQIL